MFFKGPATAEIYTLSLHDALPSAAGPLAIPVLVRAFRRAKSERVGFALVLALKTSEASANVSAVELAKLLSAYPSNVQTVGKEVLKKLGVNLKEQKARLAELAPLEAGGDAERGRQIFFGKKAACANCHTVAALGGKVGPDLSAIGKIRSGGDLIEETGRASCRERV